MEPTRAEPEAHATLTPEEEIHCHKARIFSLLINAPVVRAWKDAICDGAVYLGKGAFPPSYADRYFQTSSYDISYVTFSIVTAFKETVIDDEGQEIERSQCHISPAQRKASEFLIVTFSHDRDTVALLPHRLYWPVEGDEPAAKDKALSDEISATTLSAYSFSIKLLLANIVEIRRSAINPMHPSTTPFQIGLDGRIPKAGQPAAIMPQEFKQQVAQPGQPTLTYAKQEESAVRNMHKKFPIWIPRMKVDFLDYQPLLRDFSIIISSGPDFPCGLEAVISHSVGRLNTPSNYNDSRHLKYADYLFTHSVTTNPNYAYFVPRRLIPEAWFTSSRDFYSDLCDSGRPVKASEFQFEMDVAGRWIREIWNIIGKYPPGGHPTPAEEKQDIWMKALPWPEFEAQVAPERPSTPQKARRDGGQSSPKRDSGTGDGGAVKPSDVSLLAAHYLKKASMDDNEAGDDTI